MKMLFRGILSTVACLFAYAPTHALAGGYAGIVERVFAFQTYQIDALNPPSKQTFGFACDNWDQSAKKCVGKFVPCRGSAPGGRCNFKEFVRSLGKSPNAKGDWFVGQTGSPNRIDVEKMSKQTYQFFQKENTKISDFPAFKTIKDMESADFNKYIKRQADIVDEAAKTYRNAGNRYLWDDFDSTRKYIIQVRAGDHGPYVLKDAGKQLGMKVERQDLGPDQFDPTKRLETVDWVKTIETAEKDGVADYQKKISKFRKVFYDRKLKNEAWRHRTVIRSYKTSTMKSAICR